MAWAVEYQLDITGFNPGTFRLHGRIYPEIDRVDWVEPMEARSRLAPAQSVFVDRLADHLGLNLK